MRYFAIPFLVSNNCDVHFLNWIDLLNLFTPELSCPNPAKIDKATLDWSGKNVYMTAAKYTCHEGYFIRAGLASIMTKCSFEATWKPDHTFTCKGWFDSNFSHNMAPYSYQVF